MALRKANLDVLGRRDFRLLLGAQGVSIFGDRMVAVALAFAVLELDGSAAEVGIVLACAAVPMLATFLVGGVVADRVARRTVMAGADLVRVASQGLMAILLVGGLAQVWMLAVLAGITGAATGFFHPASTGLMPEVVTADELQPANALRTTVASLSEIGGPLAAGVIVSTAGAGWAIGADAATFAFSAACLLLMRTPPRAVRARASFAHDLREGWDAFRSRRWVWSVVASIAIVNACWAAWSSVGPVVADRELGGADTWGVVLGVFGAGALAGSLLAARIAPSRPLVHVLVMEATLAAPIGFLAAGAHAAALAAAAFVAGAALMLGMSVWESTLQRHVPAESLSRVSSYDWFASYAFYPIGLAMWGPLAAGIGFSLTLWIAFGAFVVAALAPLLVPDVRRLRWAPDRG